MNRIIEFLKNNIFGFLFVVIAGSIVIVSASSYYLASQVEYITHPLSVTRASNVQDALDELYGQYTVYYECAINSCDFSMSYSAEDELPTGSYILKKKYWNGSIISNPVQVDYCVAQNRKVLCFGRNSSAHQVASYTDREKIYDFFGETSCIDNQDGDASYLQCKNGVLECRFAKYNALECAIGSNIYSINSAPEPEIRKVNNFSISTSDDPVVPYN